MPKNLIFYKYLVFYAILCCHLGTADTSMAIAKPITWHIPPKQLPLPSCASQTVQTLLAQIKPPDIAARREFKVPSKEEWRSWVAYSQESAQEGVDAWAARYHVAITQKRMAEVPVYLLSPKKQTDTGRKTPFLYLHGGAYVFGGGLSGLSEAILIASRTRRTVIAVDYRMPPDHPFPAALEDSVNVYKALLQHYPASAVAIGGSSSGGGLALAVVHKLKALRLPLPGALFVGTPWSDLSKCGDSLFVNEGIDRKIVTYDGFIAAAAKLYADGHSLKNPYISPVYGDFSGFPPTMLVTGTRDLFLSLTVRVHRKMKAAGVDADLNVYEGLSHVEYFVIPESPESKEAYRELKHFLDRTLHTETRKHQKGKRLPNP